MFFVSYYTNSAISTLKRMSFKIKKLKIIGFNFSYSVYFKKVLLYTGWQLNSFLSEVGEYFINWHIWYIRQRYCKLMPLIWFGQKPMLALPTLQKLLKWYWYKHVLVCTNVIEQRKLQFAQRYFFVIFYVTIQQMSTHSLPSE